MCQHTDTTCQATIHLRMLPRTTPLALISASSAVMVPSSQQQSNLLVQRAISESLTSSGTRQSTEKTIPLARLPALIMYYIWRSHHRRRPTNTPSTIYCPLFRSCRRCYIPINQRRRRLLLPRVCSPGPLRPMVLPVAILEALRSVLGSFPPGTGTAVLDLSVQMVLQL